jgi:hypothetical protein
MALTSTNTFADYRTRRVDEWTLAAGETGVVLVLPGYAERSVEISGTFGGATVVIEGRNKVAGSVYFTLNDPFGNALSFTVAGLKQILENVYALRPRVTGGDGTTSINISINSKATT